MGKAELKHSSDKVVITLYIFNQQKIYLNGRLKAIMTAIFPSSKLLDRLKPKAASEDEVIPVKPLSLKRNLLLFHKEVHSQAREKNIFSIFP